MSKLYSHTSQKRCSPVEISAMPNGCVLSHRVTKNAVLHSPHNDFVCVLPALHRTTSTVAVPRDITLTCMADLYTAATDHSVCASV